MPINPAAKPSIKVSALKTREMSRFDAPIERVRGDVRHLDSLVKAMDGIEVVFNCAGFISILRSEKEQLNAVNVGGVRNVVEASARAGIRRLVHFSSIHAIQQEPFEKTLDESRPLVEDPRRPPYDLSKADGERIVKEAVARGQDCVIVNPTGVIGPHDYRPSYFGQVLLDLCNRRMPALVRAGFDWVDVRDVAQGAIAAATLADTGDIFLLSGHWHSIRYIAELVQSTTGVPTPTVELPMWLAGLAAPFTTAWAKLKHKRAVLTEVSLEALRSNRKISHAYATQKLGFQSRSFEETIVDTLYWFARQGMVEPFDN